MVRNWLLICILALVTNLTYAKSIEEFVKDLDSQTGFFTFYYQLSEDKVFLEIDKFDQPFLFQSSLPQGVGSNDIGLDRGQLGGTRLVEFERFGNKVLLKQLNTAYRVSSNNQAERDSIDEAFADSVIAGLKVVASSGSKVLVDYTPFLLSDIHQISNRLAATNQGSFKPDQDRSGVYLPKSKAFPDNTELEALVTFTGTKPGNFVRQVTPSPNNISVHLHHSLVRLPDDGYQTRAFHPYSGFWKMSYQDYSVPIESSMEQKLIPRHRLAKKDPSAEKSEAIEPIVYYLDPGIPEPIKSALYDGAQWWNQAFEAIGYKDAFQIKTLPLDADPMDVRYNVVQWVHRATRGWSYGSSVIDPRTGEIIKGLVTLGSLRVRQDYLIALGLTSPFTNEGASTEKQKQMALARIRQLSAHEIGHTLGLAHNFAASADGRESVMDYPHPKVKVVNGKISLEEAYDIGMGEWDLHTISYGYQDLPENINEGKYLNDIIAKAHKKGLSYQSDPDSRAFYAANAEGHLWDNGENPLDELANLFEVRQTALSQFGINTIQTGQSLASLQEKLVPIYYLHRYQLEAVAKLIGGVNYQYELKGDFDSPKGISHVVDEQQQKALDALINTLTMDFLKIPKNITRLITPKVYGETKTRESFNGRTGVTFDAVSAAEASAGFTLSLLLEPHRLNRLAARPIGKKEQLTLVALLNRLIESTIQQDPNKMTLAIKQRVDHLVLNALMGALEDKVLAPEAKGTIVSRVKKLHKSLSKSRLNPHHEAMALMLDWFVQTGEWKGHFDVKPLPPGSPI